MIRAIVFDIGRTLTGYQKPLNWSALYRPALEYAVASCGIEFTETDYQHAIKVLTQYNTRVNPREYEVSSAQIFREIFSGSSLEEANIASFKHGFYSFFRRDAVIYPEVEHTLRGLRERGILLGTLSDVAYGMDNSYVLDDIAPLLPYIQYPFTSNDTGYRKPSVRGLQYVAEQMQLPLSEIAFVGDEEKDILCANLAGAYSILINRSGEEKPFGQKLEIRSLDELLEMI